MKAILFAVAAMLISGSASAQLYNGWRDQVDQTKGSGRGKSAAAKIDSCAGQGSDDDTSWNTKLKCTSANPHLDNLYCTNAVWDDLCVDWYGK